LSWPSWLTHSGRLTHEVVTRQPWIRRRSGKVRQLQTDVLTTEPCRQPQGHLTTFRLASVFSNYWKLRAGWSLGDSRVRRSLVQLWNAHKPISVLVPMEKPVGTPTRMGIPLEILTPMWQGCHRDLISVFVSTEKPVGIPADYPYLYPCPRQRCHTVTSVITINAVYA